MERIHLEIGQSISQSRELTNQNMRIIDSCVNKEKIMLKIQDASLEL